MREPMKGLSVLPIVGHPRDSKRVEMLIEGGVEVLVAAFSRDSFESRRPNCPVISLGSITNGRYIRRLLKMVVAAPRLRRLIAKTDFVYASGTDMALLSIVAGIGLSRPIVVEVGDIRKIQITSTLLGAVVRAIDRFVAVRAAFVVATAAGFVEWYYQQILGITPNYFLLENKLEPKTPKARDVTFDFHDCKPITIGYFGVLRCNWTFELLKSLCVSRPDSFAVRIAGIPMIEGDVSEADLSIANFTYMGTYESPGDLENLYSGVDLVWACYPPPDHRQRNEDWWRAQAICRSNRFYESCYFGKPIVSVAGSGDAAVVREYGIGLVLDLQDLESVAEQLTAISSRDLCHWAQNIAKMPRSVYEYTNEPAELASRIAAATRGSCP